MVGEMWGHRFMMPQTLGENVGTLRLAKRGKIGSKLGFHSVDEKIRKRSAGENEEVSVNIHQLFFFLHEIDHLSNISMHRTVEQLAENSGVNNAKRFLSKVSKGYVTQIMSYLINTCVKKDR